MIKCALVLIASAMLFAAGGCSSSATVGSWQQGVEKYVRLHGGDPNVLRESTLSGNRRGIAVIGDANAKKSTDVNGVLLAHKPIDGTPTFIYLVGQVKDLTVEDIRLITLSYANGHPVWKVGPKDAHALKRYRDYGRELWNARHAGSGKSMGAHYQGCPRDEDRFNLDIQDHQVQATHEQSGAAWYLYQRGKAR